MTSVIPLLAFMVIFYK